MTESKARKLVSEANEKEPSYRNGPDENCAIGYLEALEKAGGLEILAENSACCCHEESNFVCPRCVILEKWRNEK